MATDVSAATQTVPTSRKASNDEVNDEVTEAVLDPARLEAVDGLFAELVRFMRLVKRISSRTGPNSSGIEFAAYALLAHIVCDGPMRTTALADVVHADPSTVSRQVAALVRHGLLRRQADPLDGRASLLVATPDGTQVFENARKQRSVILAKMLAGWPPEDVRLLHELLDRLNTDCETSEFVQGGRAPVIPEAAKPVGRRS